MKRQLLAVLLCVTPLAASAQQGSPARLGPPIAANPIMPGGTVTGHVYCGDTQRPARFADVELLQAADMNAREQNIGYRGQVYQTVVHGRTGLDGSFVLTGVPAGDYFVSGSMAGYVSPAAMARVTQSAITNVPSTHVQANGTSDVVVSMERGAVVSGRVTYDDGSPVPGVSVHLRLAGGSTAPRGSAGIGSGNSSFNGGGLFGNMGFGQTDDRGVFRLTGVSPGQYTVIVTIPTQVTGIGSAGGVGARGFQPTLTLYAPGSMHKVDARVVDIRGADTVDGVDIQVALIGLHVVLGRVESKADGHLLNAGFVTLTDLSDGTLARSASVSSDGSFHLDYLTPGTYTLNVQGEDRSEGSGAHAGSAGRKRYDRATSSVVVGDHDVTVDAIQLDEVTPQ